MGSKLRSHRMLQMGSDREWVHGSSHPRKPYSGFVGMRKEQEKFVSGTFWCFVNVFEASEFQRGL